MFAYNLSHCLIEYEIVVQSPVFIGGALKPLYKGKPHDKSRGEDYVLSSEKRSQDDSDIDLSIFYPLYTQNGEFWKFLIPASSIKGLLRDYCYTFLEDILKEEGKTLCDIWRDDGQFGNIFIRQAFGTTDQRGLITFYPATNDSAGASKASYSDLEKTDRSGTPKRNISLRLVTQNKLDRIIMATTEGLRTLGTVETANIFQGRFELRNFPWWAIGLLGIGIAGFNTGNLKIGAKSGTGFGEVNFNIKGIYLSYHRKVPIPAGSTTELPGIGKIIKSLGLEFEYLKASLPKAEKPENKPLPLFLLTEDDVITQSVKKKTNTNPFYGEVLVVDDTYTLFKNAISNVKHTLISILEGDT